MTIKPASSFYLEKMAGQEGLEPQHSVLETDALPIELLTYDTQAESLDPRLVKCNFI